VRDRPSLLPLAVALAIAAALRLWGIGFGLPLTAAHPDEVRVSYEGVSVLGGTFRPGFFNYLSLFMYALAVADAGSCAAGVLSGAHASIKACGERDDVELVAPDL
jgi:hypothetical protein